MRPAPAARCALLALALGPLLAFPARAQGAVLVVDDDAGPGVDFPELQPAVDAAEDGDLILLHPGSYSHAAIHGKSLSVVVDGEPGSATVAAPFSLFSPAAPALLVEGLGAGQSVIVRGLSLLTLGFLPQDIVLRVEDCDGPVVLEDCIIDNSDGYAAAVRTSLSVAFVGSRFDPGLSFYDSVAGAHLTRPGLDVESATVFLYDCEVLGSIGPDAQSLPFIPHTPPGEGGEAVRLHLSTLFASGSSLQGGDGGSSEATVCDPGSDGGDGIAYGAGSLARLLDTAVTGGAAGLAGPGCGLPDGSPGQAFDGPRGGVLTLPGAARSFAASSPVAEGTQVDLVFEGAPGDAVIVVLALEPGAGIYHDAFGAVQLVAAPFLAFPFGVVPAGGVLSAGVPIPALGAGVDFARYPLQALFVAPPAVFHSGPTAVAILDAAF